LSEFGQRIEAAPTGIVTDSFAADQTVRNGLACMRCHDKGMKPFGDEVRPAIEGTALPLAALAAFECRMAASGGLPVRLFAAVVASLIIGGVPHLAFLRAAGREGLPSRLGRDAAVVAVLVPVLLAAVAPSLPW